MIIIVRIIIKIITVSRDSQQNSNGDNQNCNNWANQFFQNEDRSFDNQTVTQPQSYDAMINNTNQSYNGENNQSDSEYPSIYNWFRIEGYEPGIKTGI